MTNREQISIRTERAGEDRVKVVWSDSTGARFPPYRLLSKSLRDKVKDVRLALEKLTAAYIHPRPDFVEATAGLALRGHQLRMALFNDYPPEDHNAVSEPQAWFESLIRDRANSVIITVHADPILPIPWGLLHEHGRAPLGGDDLYDGFWALRHEIATIYSGMAPQSFQTARPAQNVKLLSGLDQAVFDNIRRQLDPEQRDFISSFLDRPVGRAFSSQGCRERWQQVGYNHCVIHFFGHATGSELRFSEADLLTVSNFRALFRRESRVVRAYPEPVFVLTFLNGCSSVSGEDAESFLMATADPGFCGFIGTEAAVPDAFAILFGQELLYTLLVEGLSVREAMSLLWRKHKPMALLYGCYAHPNFTVARDEKHPPLPVGFDLCNFHRGIGAGS
jgi:hypothetical protein